MIENGFFDNFTALQIFLRYPKKKKKNYFDNKKLEKKNVQ